MSEYQYYEFQAIDRPLSQTEMAELRALSTRAIITPTRLQNVYHWGNFKGNPSTLMERYFDAFVYVANWGTHQCMLRLPRRVLAAEAAHPYSVADCATVRATRDHVILEFVSESEEGGGWIEDEEAESWMPSLIQVRADLASGDLRALYLAWLAGLRSDMLDEETVEPPVPPGLAQLSASLTAFAEFLSLDHDLLAVAAERSAPPAKAPSRTDLARWIQELPASEKDATLLRLLEGDPAHLRVELLRRFRQSNAPRMSAPEGGRTVAELLGAAERRAEAKRREQAEQEAKERVRREAERAAARTAYLDALGKREEDVWRQVEALVETKRPKEYDQAVQLLLDLSDLHARRGGTEAFNVRFRELRSRYTRRPGFLERLDRSRLPSP